jgi:high-affinity nickel permease
LYSLNKGAVIFHLINLGNRTQLAAEIGFALLGTGLGLGLRHGVDWDHIAAISDVASSQKSRARGYWLGTLYALGHALVVVVLGLIAIWFGTLLPDWIDGYMEILVGLTLLGLGVWLIFSMYLNKGRLTLKSRWMLLFDLSQAGWRKLRGNHAHHHSDTPRDYSDRTTLSIGMIHGIGAETGSQALLLAAAAGATSTLTGSFLLISFVVGLVVSNSLITIAATAGLLSSDRFTKVQTGLGLVIAAFSLTLGAMFIFGYTEGLPEFFV